MLLKYGLPLLSIAGVCLAVYTVSAQSKPPQVMPPVANPASAPFAANVPGAGLVEPSTEFISIGTHTAGVVAKVFVKANDEVKAGDPLFQIDDRQVRAELASRMAAVDVAEAELQRMMAMPRPEDLPPLEARVLEADSQLADARAQLEKYESVPDKRAVSADEWTRRRFAVTSAEARVAEARAQLDLLKAGAWKPDIAIRKANLDATKAEVERIKVDLDRLSMKAPVNGQILKMNVRPGQYVQGGAMGSNDLITMGDTQTLHIRVDIDENDAWRLKAGQEGMAYVRGNSKLSTRIEFVRFEPYVIPKRSLTGSSGERVDTRVLQVIYKFKRSDLPVFVGQQMDVFIKSDPIGDATFGATSDQAGRDLGGKAN